jgi:Domain of unknown function (DUF4123)
MIETEIVAPEKNRKGMSSWPSQAFANAQLVNRALRGASDQQATLWAVVDAARHKGNLYRGIELHQRHCGNNAHCLFDGEAFCTMSRGAPWLLPLSVDSPLIQRWFDIGWGDAWGIFLASSERDPAIIKRHLKKFLSVTLPGTQQQAASPALFRFYDPRVLRETLPLLPYEQTTTMFGDVITSWVAEDETGVALMQYTQAHATEIDRIVAIKQLSVKRYVLPALSGVRNEA